jgi:H+/gluconate symporter-like permease
MPMPHKAAKCYYFSKGLRDIHIQFLKEEIAMGAGVILVIYTLNKEYGSKKNSCTRSFSKSFEV